MPFRICKSFEIENGHMLSKHPDKCRFPHGHSRKVEFILEATELDASGMVCDFKVVKEVMSDYLESLDHAMCMNSRDPAFTKMKELFGDRIVVFEGVEPTTEVMAKEIFGRCEQALRAYSRREATRYQLRNEVRLVSVKLWETSSSWAEYFA